MPLSFEQLVNESQSVVYGRVTDVRAQWTDDRRFIESVVTIEILRGMKGSARRVDRVHGAGRTGRTLPERHSRRAELRAGRSGGVLSHRAGRAAARDDRTHAGHLSRAARRASGEMLVVPPVVEAPARIVRGDPRRKPVSLAAFEARRARALARAPR